MTHEQFEELSLKEKWQAIEEGEIEVTAKEYQDLKDRAYEEYCTVGVWAA